MESTKYLKLNNNDILLIKTYGNEVKMVLNDRFKVLNNFIKKKESSNN